MKNQKRIGALAAAVILGMGAFAMPHTAQATDYEGSDTITIDKKSESESGSTTKNVIGVKNMAMSEETETWLPKTSASGWNTMALGVGSQATGDYSLTYGSNSTATGYASIAIGGSAAATWSELPEGSKASTGGTIAIGGYAKASGNGGVAVGAVAEATGSDTVAMGSLSVATGKESVALGSEANAGGDGAVALGVRSKVSGVNAVAVGSEASAGAENAVAIGKGAAATVSNAVAIGTEAVASEANTVSFGHKKGDQNYDSDSFVKLTNVANGTGVNEVATWDQLIGKAEYDVTTGKLTFTKNNEEKATIEVTIPNSVAAVGDTKKLSKAGLGENVTDSVLSVNDKVETLNEDVKKVGAGAAALAALHPEAFDPMDKWSFAVGYGHYKNANAGALGAFFKPNADTTLSIGSTIGNGNPMMNAGLSFKFGQRSAKLSQNASNSQLVQEVNTLRAQNEEQAQEIRELKEQMAQVLAKLGEKQ